MSNGHEFWIHSVVSKEVDLSLERIILHPFWKRGSGDGVIIVGNALTYRTNQDCQTTEMQQ